MNHRVDCVTFIGDGKMRLGYVSGIARLFVSSLRCCTLRLLVAALLAIIAIDVASAAPNCSPRAVSTIDAAVKDTYATRRLPSLTVAVLCGDIVVYLHSYGYSDVDDGVSASPATAYEIGSITKQFTAAGIVLLEHQGRLALDDRVSKYVPEFPLARRLTILELLNHTSGLSEYSELPNFSTLEVNKTTPLQTLNDLNPTVRFPPGKQFYYSSSNYVLLGMIIDKLTGQRWQDFIRATFFLPANMSTASFYDPTRVVSNRAMGYEGSGTSLAHAEYHDPSWAFGEGGIVATASDLMQWDRALFADRILDPQMFSEMQEPGRLSDGSTTNYGMGFFLGGVSGHREIWHGGVGVGGFRSENILFPDDHVAFVFLSNSYDFKPNALLKALTDAVFD